MGDDLNQRAAWLARHVLPNEPALRSWLRGRRLNGLDIDDIVQETYARLIIMENVDHILNPKTYTFQIAGSVVADQLRHMKVVAIGSAAYLEHRGINCLGPSPENEVIDRDELQRLSRAIAALPEKLQQVFTLRRVFGFSQREVALKMGIAESTVEKHLARGLLLMLDLFLNSGKGTDETSTMGPARGEVRRIHAKKDRSGH
jgi:RNA polymerase sigma factor (sigma-70 family)